MEYVQSGVVMAILAAVGWMFLRAPHSPAQSNWSGKMVRWTGYMLIACTILIAAAEVMQIFVEEAHRHGH
ncbi:hypothetical protein [Paenibacillus thalictri]|uniref:Uncharacterized protein n=1 Tax=Paenibacillus thalictri TaxID=2527873 RepID=A0A4Q9DP81_9BACL|nr:hypothetical protein [Paenibacillus thalictri]TBL75775.1 hypothetical protein EYB31_22600 [Paenibacillus thalictri]